MKRTATAALLGAVLLASPASASEDLTEIRRFSPFNLGNNASFGHSVAANLTRTVTGTPFIDLVGDDSGAVYVHATNTGQQLFRLTAPDAGTFDRFGFSVAATGQRVIVGADFANGAVDGTGAVYIFDIQTGGFLSKVTAPDGEFSDGFGRSVGASGARFLVGAPADDDNGGSSGSAYIYDLPTGQLLHKLTANDGAVLDFFGHSVAISNNLAVVGAIFDDYDGISTAGSAYVFNAFNGQQLHKLTPSQPQESGNFGISVAISGNLIVVGSEEDVGDELYAGAAYVFDAVTGEELHRLTPSTLSGFDRFGGSVAISGNLIIVGALDDSGLNEYSGTAFIFDAQSGQELYRLVASDGKVPDEFGSSVAVIGTQAFIGATTANTPGIEAGATYIFDITPCFADVNDDNTVDLADLNIILAAFGQATPNGDTNFDGVVDLTDINRVLSEFGTECP